MERKKPNFETKSDILEYRIQPSKSTPPCLYHALIHVVIILYSISNIQMPGLNGSYSVGVYILYIIQSNSVDRFVRIT